MSCKNRIAKLERQSGTEDAPCLDHLVTLRGFHQMSESEEPEPPTCERCGKPATIIRIKLIIVYPNV